MLDGDCWKFAFLFRYTILNFSCKCILRVDSILSTQGVTIQIQDENAQNFIQE